MHSGTSSTQSEFTLTTSATMADISSIVESTIVTRRSSSRMAWRVFFRKMYSASRAITASRNWPHISPHTL